VAIAEVHLVRLVRPGHVLITLDSNKAHDTPVHVMLSPAMLSAGAIQSMRKWTLHETEYTVGFASDFGVVEFAAVSSVLGKLISAGSISLATACVVQAAEGSTQFDALSALVEHDVVCSAPHDADTFSVWLTLSGVDDVVVCRGAVCE
jgi:hypothetical protein